MKFFFTLLTLLPLSLPLHAQERNAPVAISILGPVSTNLNDYDRTNNFLCLGLINCSALNSYGLTFTIYGYNITGEDMVGVAAAPFANVALGNLRGLQAGAVNYAHQKAAGLQLGLINAIQDHDDIEDPNFAVQYGIVNYSQQRRVVPIGLINIVRGGVLSLEINRSAIGLNRLNFLTGSRYFYMIWGLNSSGINSKDKKDFAATERYLESLGFGVSWEYQEGEKVKAEYSFYTPSGYVEDESNVIRLLWEREFLPALAFNLGVEQLEYRRDRDGLYYRNTHWRQDQRSRSITMGLSVNALGFWK